ncbi:MAG: hypothetical protein V4631_08850 [Pseudomonadota bacterium]
MFMSSTAALQQSCQFTVSTRRKPAGAPPHGCCNDGSGAQANALASLAILTASCSAANVVVGNNPLGRYADNGTCTYSCCNEQYWNWWCDFRNTNANLEKTVTNTDFTAAYANAFVPAQTWVGSALPGLSGTLAENIGTIIQIDAAIRESGGETPQQAAQLNTAFLSLANAVQNNQGQMNGATQNIASFLAWEGGQTGVLATAVTNSKAYITTTATNVENNLIGQISCGSGDVQESFQNMFNDIANKFATMQTGFSSVAANCQAALTACQQVGGQFLPLLADGANIQAEVANALSLPPASIMRLLHLKNAQGEWNQMAQNAGIQLQPA